MIAVDPPHSGANRTFLIVLGSAAIVLAFVLKLTGLAGLGVGLLLYVAIGYLLAQRSGRGLSATRELYPSAFEKDQVAVKLRVANTGNSVTWLLEVSDLFAPSLAGRHTMLEVGPLHPQRQRTMGYVGFVGKNWGVYDCGPITLTTADPMGFFHRESNHGDFEPFAVFPRVLDVGGLPVRGSLASLVPQDSSSASPGQGAMYLGVRDYRSGDDVRRIHWPAMARRGKPMIREMEVDLVPYFTLLVDFEERFRSGMGLQSTSELVIRTAASLLWTACKNGSVFQCFGEPEQTLYLGPGMGQGHLTRALFELIYTHADGRVGIQDVIDQYRGALPRGSVVAILASHVRLDLPRLEEQLDGLVSGGIKPALVVCNNFSFRQVDGFAPPAAEQEKLVAAVEDVIFRHDMAGLILNRRTGEGVQQEELAAQLERGLI